MTAARWVLVAAVFAGVSYVGSWAAPLPAWAAVTWKGAGVALLAVYAAMGARRLDGWLLVAVMAFGALGDVLLETNGRVAGALAFLAGHLTAVALYLRNYRPALRPWELAVGAGLIPMITGTAVLVTAGPGAGQIALYAVGLAAMAATAWLSRFPRGWVAAGALMFAVSDLLIFTRTGRPALDTFLMGLAVWGLYFGGQTLVAVGAVRAIASTGVDDP